jgi:hypothetical protein
MCVRLTRFAPPADRPSRKANPPRQLAAKGGAAAAAAKENAATRASALKVSRQVKAGATRAVEIPSGPSSAELLETFAQTLEDVFEKVDESASLGARGGRASFAEDGEWLTREEVADLATKTTVLVDGGLMRSVPPGSVVRLLDVLEKHVARADDVDVREDEDERSAKRADGAARAGLRVAGAARAWRRRHAQGGVPRGEHRGFG